MEVPKIPLNAILVLLLIAAAFTIGAFWQRLEKLSPQAKLPTTAQEPEGEIAGEEVGERKEVSVDDDPVVGDASAPVTIIEFSDFQCPYCAVFATQTFPQLKQEYIDTGKVKLVYRDLPLTQIGHRNAPKAAEAAECAAEQNKFLEYHDQVFEKQADWSTADDPSSLFKDYANELGLDDEFAACLDSGRRTEEVQKDAAAAQVLGVNGTPTFFIGRGDTLAFNTAPTRTDPFFYLDGQKAGVVGAQPFEVFKEIIDSLL